MHFVVCLTTPLTGEMIIWGVFDSFEEAQKDTEMEFHKRGGVEKVLEDFEVSICQFIKDTMPHCWERNQSGWSKYNHLDL